MKTTDKFRVFFLPVFILMTLLIVGGFEPSFAQSSRLSTAVFYVQ